VAVAILALVAASFAALLASAVDRPTVLSIGPYLLRILMFSGAQACVSTLLSVAFGTAVALALARRRFPGRRAAVAVLGAAAVMPAIVVVFSILAIYGRAGFLAEALSALGLEVEIPVFGWTGIVLAHVFLNGPFVARVVMDGLGNAPAEHWRLAAAFGFGPAEVFRHLDLPVLRAELPGLASLVFLLCFTSFAIVLALGGGPGRATLEVAIYEALKLDLDFARAAWLAFVQVAICLAIARFLHTRVERVPLGTTDRAALRRADAAHRGLRRVDILVLLAAALFVGPPVLAVLSGLAAVPRVLDSDLLRALATSLAIAAAAATLACLLALALAAAARHHFLVTRQHRLAALHEFLPAAMLALPPFSLAAGLFLILRGFTDPALAGYWLLPVVNAFGALPFAYSFVGPALHRSGERYGRLSALLGLNGVRKLRLVDWPLVRRPLAAAFAMSAALSFGDFGVVALFGGTELRTLPYLLYERLGAYRIEEASGIGALILLVAFCLSFVSGLPAHADRR
jgi:thiamine transport system permease protein